MRTCDREFRAARRRLQTISWIHAVRRSAVHENDLKRATFYGLKKILASKYSEYVGATDESRSIGRYARGKRTPTVRILERIESIYPGTRAVFESGPDGSRLWQAISCRDPQSARRELLNIKDDLIRGFHVPSQIVRGTTRNTWWHIPASLAAVLELSDADRAAPYRKLAEQLLRNPDLQNWLSVSNTPYDELAEGPLMDVNPDVFLFSDERQQRRRLVKPPALTALTIQILNAKSKPDSSGPLYLERWQDIERRLGEFGLSVEPIAEVAQVRFSARPSPIRSRSDSTDATSTTGVQSSASALNFWTSGAVGEQGMTTITPVVAVWRV